MQTNARFSDHLHQGRFQLMPPSASDAGHGTRCQERGVLQKRSSLPKRSFACSSQGSLHWKGLVICRGVTCKRFRWLAAAASAHPVSVKARFFNRRSVLIPIAWECKFDKLTRFLDLGHKGFWRPVSPSVGLWTCVQRVWWTADLILRRISEVLT